jgi:hypothetical protein
MFGKGNCEKYQSRDEIFPELNGERNVVSRLVFFIKGGGGTNITI